MSGILRLKEATVGTIPSYVFLMKINFSEFQFLMYFSTFFLYWFFALYLMIVFLYWLNI